MVGGALTRRAAVLGLSMLAIAVRGHAEAIIDLGWRDLLPEDDTPPPVSPWGILTHDEGSLASRQPMSTGIRTDWNAQLVRLSGFIVPIDYEGTGVTTFILVPYVGACIHVPPPPANQLVFVTTRTPFQSSGLFEAVTVTGMFGTVSTSTQLAEIGYTLSAEDIRPYRK